MNWSGVFEQIVAAVVGALILSAIIWFFSRASKRKPIEWFELSDGSTQLDTENYRSKVAYCTVLVRNRKRELVKNVELLCNGDVHEVEVERGTKYEIEKDGSDSRVKIAALQANQALKVTLHERGSSFLTVRKVFAQDEDMGSAVRHRVVNDASLVLPPWMNNFGIPISIGVLTATLFSATQAWVEDKGVLENPAITSQHEDGEETKQ